MNYAYFRQLPGATALSGQYKQVTAFAFKEGITIDREVVEYSYKELPLAKRGEFEAFLRSIKRGDRLIVSSLRILSSQVEEVVKVINCILRHEAVLCLCDADIKIHGASALAEVFPLLHDLQKQTAQKQNRAGRPKGSKSSSKFDRYHTRIVYALREGKNVSTIARELGVSRSSLKDYIHSRGLKELAEGSWIGNKEATDNHKKIVLICPFEQEIA